VPMVRVNGRTVRHLISTGYLSLESSGVTPAVAIALEAWILRQSHMSQSPAAQMQSPLSDWSHYDKFGLPKLDDFA
jgi:hypothetical protein